MGGYCGSMAIALRNNKKLLGDKIRNTRKDYLGTKDIPTDDHVQATPEVLESLRIKFQKEKRNKSKFNAITFIISIIIAIFLIYAASTIKYVGLYPN